MHHKLIHHKTMGMSKDLLDLHKHFKATKSSDTNIDRKTDTWNSQHKYMLHYLCITALLLFYHVGNYNHYLLLVAIQLFSMS